MYSNKKPVHNPSSQRSAPLHTGLADLLSSVSFQPLPSSSAWEMNSTKARSSQPVSTSAARSIKPAPVPSNENYKVRSQVTSPSLNTGLWDALKTTYGPQEVPKVQQPVTASLPAHAAVAHHSSHQPLAPGASDISLPSIRLIRRQDLPEEESTSNYVFVDVRGVEYGYPIHAWKPVMQMCEAVFRNSHKPLVVKNCALKAIRQVVQGFCNRGPFNLIPRSTIEHAVRSLLNSEFEQDQTRHSTQPQTSDKTITVIAPLAAKLGESYEERIRNVHSRQQPSGLTQVSTSRARLDAYLAAKTLNSASISQHELPGAFTRKVEDARTVWLGLDFGTQNMKAAFRDGETDDQSVILELNHKASGIDRYLLSPSMRIHGKNLVFSAGAKSDTPSWKHALSVFYGDSYMTDGISTESWLDKARNQSDKVATRSTAELVLFFASLHLGFVLSRIGEGVRQYYRHQQINDPLAFRVFMCAPVAALDDQLSQLVFQDCLTIADQLHGILDFSHEYIPMDQALDAFDKACKLGVLLEPRLSRRARVVPEVIAEIASYAQSRSAREGVYALVDVGAGTLDLNVFKVVRSTAERGVTTPVFAASCHPNGVTHLESLLLEALGEDGALNQDRFEEQKHRMAFPDITALAHACISKDSDIRAFEGQLMNAHRDYCSDVADRTRKTWAEAWAKRGIEKDWAHLTMFLCGGGAAVHGIHDHLQAGMPSQLIHRIIKGVLPCPAEEEFVRPPDFPEEQFHRVAVAYGLTFGSDFEPYLLPSQIHELQVHRETEDISERFVSMEMV